MSDTPRTDAAAIRCACSTYVVPSEFARELERENAALNHKLDEILTNKNYEGGVQFWINKHDEVLLREASLRAENAVLRADRDRLDWLEGEDGQSWTAKWYYWGEEWINRAAIDAAMKETQP